VGSFLLAPLLAVLAWLLLSIGGTQDPLTFALVSFAIGLTTKTIITRVMNFVGEKVPDDTTSPSTPSEPTSITVDPSRAAAGQMITIKGKGFAANSPISLEYSGNGIVQGIPSPFSSSTDTFDCQLWLQEPLSLGKYTINAKDVSRRFASAIFTVASTTSSPSRDS
jgi:hypothetical protein